VHNVIHVKSVFDTQGPDPDPELKALARKAEKNHDARGWPLSRRAQRISPKARRLAEKAVHFDPKLTWIYAVIAVQRSSLPRSTLGP